MRVVERFLNRSEQIVFDELSTIAVDNGLRAFPKSRMSDVLVKGDQRLTDREFSLYTRSHFDFVVTDHAYKPHMVVEFDGPYHEAGPQAARDGIKNAFCAEASLPMLRINMNHVSRRYRGMSLLRWLIEVSQLEIAFYEAQENGHIPLDEPFDPMMIAADGTGRRWPYWLSVEANTRIQKFLLAQEGHKASISMSGVDAKGNHHYLQYLRTDSGFLYVKTAARAQGVGFAHDLLGEIAACELHQKLQDHLQGKLRLLSKAEFQPIHDRFCEKYRARSHSGFGDGLDSPLAGWKW